MYVGITSHFYFYFISRCLYLFMYVCNCKSVILGLKLADLTRQCTHHRR